MGNIEAKPKSIKKGILYTGFYQILSSVAPLITAPYISRVMGVEGYGFFYKTVSIAYYFFIFAMLGVNTYGNREIAAVRDDEKKRSETFWQIYYLQLILGLTSTALYFLFVVFFIPDRQSFYFIQGIYVFSTCTDINWYAYGLEEFRFITIRNTVIKLTTTACIFLFIKSPEDLDVYFYIYAISVVLALLTVWSLVLRTTHIVRPEASKMLKHLKPNIILFLPYIAMSLYTQMDKVMVGVLVSDSEVGYYNYAENILAIPMGLMTAVTDVMLPRASYLIGSGKEKESGRLFDITVRYAGIFNVALVFGLLAVAQVFIPWYLGKEYGYTADLLMVLSPIILINAIAALIRTQLLIPNGREKEYTISIVIGALANLILNFFFISRLHAVGACITTIIADVVVLLAHMAYTWKQYDYLSFCRRLLPYIVIGGSMLAGLLAMRNWMGGMPDLLRLVVLVLVGALFYCLTSGLYLRFVEKDQYIGALLKSVLKQNRKNI